MNTQLKTYISSFKLDRKLIYSILIDAALILFLYFAVTGSYSMLIQRSLHLTGGKDADTLRQSLTAAGPQAVIQYLHDLNFFILLVIGGGLLLSLTILLAITISRMYLWRILADYSITKSVFWRWLLLTLLLGLFLLLSVLFILLLKFLLLISLQKLFADPQYLFFIVQFCIYFVILLIVMMLFLVHYSFTQKLRIGSSMSYLVHLIRHNYSSLWKAFLFILGTAYLLGAILFAISYFASLQESTVVIISAILSLLFLSWIRIYLLKVVSGHQQTIFT